MLGMDVDEDIYQFSDLKNKTLKVGADLGVSENAYEFAFLDPISEVIQLDETDSAYIHERARIEAEAQRSVYFSSRKYFERTVNPRLFDRVFSVFVDLQELLDKGAAQENISIDQFYCTVNLTEYQLDLQEESDGPDLKAIKSAFESKHGIHAGLPGSRQQRF